MSKNKPALWEKRILKDASSKETFHQVVKKIYHLPGCGSYDNISLRLKKSSVLS